MSEKINISINEGESFFAHETSINFNPTHFVLDFKCITPRIDLRSDKPSLHIKHNVVILEPYHLKKLVEMFSQALKKYEKDFGKIEKPKSVKRFEKKHKKTKKKEKQEIPNYFG